MCRMMGVVAPNGVDSELLARFRSQARGHVPDGDSPGHADGWGIAYYEGGRPEYAGRSTSDALTDPLYPAAVDELRKRRPVGPLLAHVRKASAGATSIDNTHPFVSGRWSFCHNGTVWGFAPDGQSDSRALFAALTHDIEARGRTPSEAMKRLVDEVSGLKFTSLTLLLSDGRTLWGLRKVGNVAWEGPGPPPGGMGGPHARGREARSAGPRSGRVRIDEACRENACSPDYYTLGVARIGDQTVVSQEHEFLAVDAWHVVPDGHVVIVGPDGHPHVGGL